MWVLDKLSGRGILDNKIALNQKLRNLIIKYHPLAILPLFCENLFFKSLKIGLQSLTEQRQTSFEWTGERSKII